MAQVSLEISDVVELFQEVLTLKSRVQELEKKLEDIKNAAPIIYQPGSLDLLSGTHPGLGQPVMCSDYTTTVEGLATAGARCTHDVDDSSRSLFKMCKKCKVMVSS